MSDLNGDLPQLQMVWPTHELVRAQGLAEADAHLSSRCAEADAGQAFLPLRLARGYSLRIFQPEVDDAEYVALMQAAGFEDWRSERLTLCHMTALPYGWFLAVHQETGASVATAMATHRPGPYHPFGAELSWVAAHPEHRGRKLGWTVCAAATNRLLQAGYTNIYLRTDDARAPAILTYLRMGYLPFLYMPGMAARWQSICTLLEWPYTPEAWPNVE